MAVGAIFTGFGWFLLTFLFYYQNHSTTYAFFQNTVVHSNRLLQICLFSASVTYLCLLLFPALRLFRNWKYVQQIKKEGHQKAKLEYRLFVNKVSFLLGIKKKVKVAVSALVSSPVTVGYLKPVILLPVAAMNNLTPAQVEAILLHELSHIRRYDYLLNFVVSVIHTLLYFNPFIKSFINVIEAEREACCDEMVLQFGYDKVGYASALLHLEKTGGRQHALALAAAGKQNLLTRIEKIVGMEKKKTFRLVQIVPLFVAMFCVLLFNSVLIIKDARSGEAMAYTSDTVFTPWQLDVGDTKVRTTDASFERTEFTAKTDSRPFTDDSEVKIDIYNINGIPAPADPAEPAAESFIPVNFDEVEGRLSKEDKNKVNSLIETTKKYAKTVQWKEIEATIADAMSTREKAIAQQEYLHEMEKVDWKNISENVAANFENLDWKAVEETLAKVQEKVALDSMQTIYSMALTELQKAESNLKSQKKCTVSPMPDASVKQIQMAREVMQKKLAEVKEASKPKKVISL
jgi:beta-lactamase regulating signal transducer with metallopeptidase domain